MGKAPNRISALLLAAGSSSRFAGTKQLAKIGGRTLVQRALDVIPAGELRETVVVLGCDAAAVAKAVGRRKGVRVVVNEDYRGGMGSSIRAGVSGLAEDAEGVVILLADQPFVTASLLRRMLAVFEAEGREGIVAAAHRGEVSPPAIFSRTYFGELAELAGDRGARSIIERHPEDVSLVNVRSRRTLTDIDTRDDLEAARRLLEPRKSR